MAKKQRTEEQDREERFTTRAGQLQFFDKDGNEFFPEWNKPGAEEEREEDEADEEDDYGDEEDDYGDEEEGEDESPESDDAENYGGAPGERTHKGDPEHEE